MSPFAFASGAASPRKRPAQARSEDTVAAILTATIQVLARDGEALTTTRVAEVAGVSVGTLYQYFPNREALITGVLADHLEAAIGAVEREAESVAGLPRAVATERIVRAFLTAKAERVDVAVVMQRVFGVGKLDDRPVVMAATRRAQVVVARLFDDVADDVAMQRAQIACGALEGAVRAALAEDPRLLADEAWRARVVQMSIAAFGS